MEHRLEASKKQHDTIEELQQDLNTSRKNEKLLDQQVLQAQEEANQLRNDVAKLQAAAAAAGNEKKSACDFYGVLSQLLTFSAESTAAMEIPAIALEGNLETSYLLEQVRSIRRFRSEF